MPRAPWKPSILMRMHSGIDRHLVQGLVFKAHRLWFHSTLGLRVIKKKQRKEVIREQGLGIDRHLVRQGVSFCSPLPRLYTMHTTYYTLRSPLSEHYTTHWEYLCMAPGTGVPRS